MRLDSPLLSPGEDAGAGNIGKHQGDRSRENPGRTSLGNGHEVRAIARTENSQTEWMGIAHAARVTNRGTSADKSKPRHISPPEVTLVWVEGGADCQRDRDGVERVRESALAEAKDD